VLAHSLGPLRGSEEERGEKEEREGEGWVVRKLT
jgi:hypothetical protein